MSEVCLPGGRVIVNVIIVIIAVVALGSPARASVSQSPGQFAVLAWNPSGGQNVTGYNLYFGGGSGSYTNVLTLGNVTSTSINGLPGTTCFFVVTARDGAGHESSPSNETSYTFPNLSVASVNLAVQPIPLQMAGTSAGLTLSTSNVIASEWVLEASSDLKLWRTLAAGSNSIVNTTVVSANMPALFFRLKGP